jgi:hypothetical protein
MRHVKDFTNVSRFAKMRLTSKGTLPKPFKTVSNPFKSRSTGRQNYAKRVQKRLAHLNISPLHHLWRYQKRGFGSSGGSETPKIRARRDVSGSAEMRLTSTAKEERREPGTGNREPGTERPATIRTGSSISSWAWRPRAAWREVWGVLWAFCQPASTATRRSGSSAPATGRCPRCTGPCR